MIYLDTGCLVKLYYPEPESPRVVAAVQGKVICYTRLHELEFTNALRLKMFHKNADAAQVMGAEALVSADLASGVLVAPVASWDNVFQEAQTLISQPFRFAGHSFARFSPLCAGEGARRG